jgi:hypothetical protein
MKTSFFKTIILILIFCLVFPPGFAKADDYEAFKLAHSASENAAARIRMAEGAVGQVLMEAMSGKYGELHKWSLIEEKMSALATTLDSSLSEIGSHAPALLKHDPNYRFPVSELGHPFEGNLNMARDKKRELLELAKQENAKLQTINNMLAKVNRALYNATREAVGESIEGFLPSEVQLGGEAAVIVLGAYFGPPGIFVAGLAVFATFTFNTVVNTYYTSKALADQVKALTPMQEMLEANRRTVEQNVNALNQAAQEMQQIEQELDKQQKKFDTYRRKITTAEENWSGQSQSAFQAKQAAIVQQAQQQAAAPKNPINISSWAYGMPPIQPIQPGEYSGEIDSIVAEMNSYSKAVEEGGDPDNFYELVSNWEKKWIDKYQPVKEDYDRKYSAYQTASEICWQKRNAAYIQFRNSINALWAAYRNKRWDDAATAAYNSIAATWNSADQAALNALAPYGQALAAPLREMARLNQIRYGIDAPFRGFHERVSNAVYYRSSDFWKKFYQKKGLLDEAQIKTGQALFKIPTYPKAYKDRADNLDSDISRALEWGGDVMSIRAGLLSTAEQLKTIGKDVKDGIKAYEEGMLEVRRLVNTGQSEMKSYLAAYGKLINHPRVGRYYLGISEPFYPDTTETSERVKWFSEYVMKTLNYDDPYYLEEAKSTDWEGIARIYETKADEFTFYVEWAEQYINRQSVASNRIDRISRSLTGLGFYTPRDGMPLEVINKEFSEPQWATITGEIEKYISESGYKTLPWAQWQPWSALLPHQKLNAALAVLLYKKINTDMKTYVQVKANGGFIPVREDVIKPIEESWKGLSALCEKYEAQAKPVRDKLGNVSEEVGTETSAVYQIWEKMPIHARRLVMMDYNRFVKAAGWFNEYLRHKNDAMKASLLPQDNSMALQIDNLISGYRPDFEKWNAEQQRIREEAERRQREWEAEQARVKAEEERRRQEEQKKAEDSLLAVKNMYDLFRQAYESKNDSQVMSFMGDDWEAGDGTTLSDLQVNLSRSFRVFDEVRYNIQNLKVAPISGGKYSASYDITITSRIYSRNIKHEEKSSVNEVVMIDGSGKPKISKTTSGRFWYVE